jgi:diguanylate cyclase (GGDEF)-like protein
LLNGSSTIIDMEHPFSLPPSCAAELRELYAEPALLGQPEPEVVARVLDLARWTSGADVGLALAGGLVAGATGLSTGVDPVALVSPQTLDDGRRVVPLAVPLLPAGLGAKRAFGALFLGPGGEDSDVERLGGHAASILIAAAVRRVGETDLLTGLMARPAFEAWLPNASERLSGGEPVSLILLDVDGLRDVNAARGVRAGDDLLKTLGVLAAAAAGERGVAARYGGDELVLALPGVDLAGARAVVDGLRGSVDQLQGFGAPAPRVSVGLAAGPEHGDDLDQLLFRADQALARAKEEGRGQVVAWSAGLKRQRRQDRLAGVLTGHPARDHRHVHGLLETVRAVSRLAPLAETLRETVDRCVAVAGASRGLLLLAQGDGWEVEVARSAEGIDLGLGAPDFAASVAAEALDAGRTVSRLAGDEGISPSAESLGLRAVLCAPLVGEDVPRGVLYVDTQERNEPFDGATLAFFDALVDQVGVALRNATLYEQLLARNSQLRDGVAGREAELARVRERWSANQRALSGAPSVPGLVGTSSGMLEVLRLLKSLEGTSVPVVVEGESGTGKELISRAIHDSSGREGPLVTVNCAAIAPGLFESELFGHLQGSFTGAHADREGLLEAANGGTLFMDEVGELPLDAQAKLLRALQEGEVRRIGDTVSRPLDVRVVAATNRDLLSMVKEGTFREDLYYRLAVFKLYLPPLRERVEDIPALAEHLLGRLRERTGQALTLTPGARRKLARYRWPGNVRQLSNALERASVLAGEGGIEVEHLDLPNPGRPGGDLAELFQLPLKEAKNAFSILYVQEMVRRADGSMPEAAKLAGVTRQTLYRILAD